MNDQARHAAFAASQPSTTLRRASTGLRAPRAATAQLRASLGGGLSLVIVFVSPAYPLEDLGAALAAAFPSTPVVGCTTAGEIAEQGYADGTIVAVGFPATAFTAATRRIDALQSLDRRVLSRDVLSARAEVAAARPDWGHEVALLLSDGLSRREDDLVSMLAPALGTIPLFGGSAGDGLEFGKTYVLEDGRFHRDAALLCLIRTRCPLRVFCFDHFVPTTTKMVVTDAVPAERLVREINAEPAAREYARLVGKDPDQLSPFIFAAHPVVVRAGGKHHVRAIQKVEANGDLRFYSAIDEGLVLTVAEAQDIALHLDAALGELTTTAGPDAIIGFDCILRRLAAEQLQAAGEVSRVLARHGVIGFSTYGEQMHRLHVNQTFTGVAFYPPGTRL